MADEVNPPEVMSTHISPPPSDSNTKRQRRPSVRLGEIGGNDPTYDPRRPSKSSSKTRPLTNFQQPKFRKPTTKRVRTNWSKLEENGNNDHDFQSESPINSGQENMGLQYWDKLSRENANSGDEEEDSVLGVRDWLSGLGLGKYAPVFQIHEVDQHVLPLLTLEDLKDMGINAVGSRRKIYSAILNLRKGLS